MDQIRRRALGRRSRKPPGTAHWSTIRAWVIFCRR